LILLHISLGFYHCSECLYRNTYFAENRGEYLEIARHKYYWNDTGISFRLLEDEDDMGKSIQEPELFCPIGMNDYAYNKKIEVILYRLFYYFKVYFSYIFICFVIYFFSSLCKSTVSYIELQEGFEQHMFNQTNCHSFCYQDR
jgi:hypothetical protein